MSKKPVFAVDVGGVLADIHHGGYCRPGAETALTLLAPKYDLQIVSMCGRNRALLTREWLAKRGLVQFFSNQTYIGFDEKNKNKVLTKIGAEYFVDDRAKHIIPAQSVKSIKKVFHMVTDIANEQPATGKYVCVWTWGDLLANMGYC